MKKDIGHSMISYHLKHKVESPPNEVLISSDVIESSSSSIISPSRSSNNDLNKNYFQLSELLETKIANLLHQLKKPLPKRIDLVEQNKLLKQENQHLKEMIAQQKTNALSYSSNHDINKMKQKEKILRMKNAELKRQINEYKLQFRPIQELKNAEEFTVYNIVNTMKEFIRKVDQSGYSNNVYEDEEDDEFYDNNVVNSHNYKLKLGYH